MRCYTETPSCVFVTYLQQLIRPEPLARGLRYKRTQDSQVTEQNTNKTTQDRVSLSICSQTRSEAVRLKNYTAPEGSP